MPTTYRTISINEEDYARLLSAAEQYSKELGVQISLPKLILKMLTEWEEMHKS